MRQAEGRCALARYEAESLLIRCQASRPAYAVLGDAYFPGWEARVNGAPAPILRANAEMRAVAVPAGTSVVEMAYSRRRLRVGLFGSALGLLLCAGLLLHGRQLAAR